MEEDIRAELKAINKSISDLTLVVVEHTSLDKGQAIPKRVAALQEEMTKKASWVALYSMSAFVIGVVTTVLLIVKGA